jgi:hypothetical protein
VIIWLPAALSRSKQAKKRSGSVPKFRWDSNSRASISEAGVISLLRLEPQAQVYYRHRSLKKDKPMQINSRVFLPYSRFGLYRIAHELASCYCVPLRACTSPTHTSTGRWWADRGKRSAILAVGRRAAWPPEQTHAHENYKNIFIHAN